MIGPGSKFTRKMEEAIGALLTQRNVEEAARATGIGPATLLRWLKVPEFQDAYREARRGVFQQTVARLQQGTSTAATALLEIIVDVDAPPSVRVRAAEVVLSHSARALELEDLESRVSALETAKNGKEYRK